MQVLNTTRWPQIFDIFGAAIALANRLGFTLFEGESIGRHRGWADRPRQGRRSLRKSVSRKLSASA